MSVTFTIQGHNDLLRTTFMTGRVVMTEGIRALPIHHRNEIIAKVRTFDAFNQINDPHGEHDFGAFDQPGVGNVCWTIDYYNRSLTSRSEDPADPEVTCRVLTVLLKEEWHAYFGR